MSETLREMLRADTVKRIREHMELLDEEHEEEEPYEGAGYCTCRSCQKEWPILRGALQLLDPTDPHYLPGEAQPDADARRLREALDKALDAAATLLASPGTDHEDGAAWRVLETLVDDRALGIGLFAALAPAEREGEG